MIGAIFARSNLRKKRQLNKKSLRKGVSMKKILALSLMVIGIVYCGHSAPNANSTVNNSSEANKVCTETVVVTFASTPKPAQQL
jgi:hypothetical protein